MTGANEVAAIKLAQAYGVAKHLVINDDPGPFRHVWEWFIALHHRRRFDGATGLSQPINWLEIKAWADVTATTLATHEIRLIEALDDMFIAEERKHRAQSEKQRQAKAKGRKR